MLEKVISYIEKNELIQRKDKIVIGVSGGADSVCLFLVLLKLQKKYELELFVVHIHHGIRGEQADRDELFVRELAKSAGVAYFSIRKDIPKLAKKNGKSEEEMGRIARYEAFYQVLKQVKGNKIAVAHNQNDCAETVLFQLFRGSGLKGMGGILAKRNEIIRPLLSIGRCEIEQYLKEEGQLYCIDQTNLEQEYTRNKIRLSILPIAEQEINEKAVEHIAKTAEFLQEVEQYIRKNVDFVWNEIVCEKLGQYFIVIEKLKEQDIVIQRELLKLLLSKVAGKAKDIEAKHIETILELMQKQTGKQLHLPYGIVVRKEYDFLVFEKENEKREDKSGYFYELLPNKTYIIEEIGLCIELKLEESQPKWDEIPQNTCVKWLDYDKIERSICIRGRQAGDYLQVNKEGGTRKLKDYFIDKKIPRQERQNIALLADGSHIIWILGDRISEKYKITENTKNILKLKIMEVEKDGR